VNLITIKTKSFMKTVQLCLIVSILLMSAHYSFSQCLSGTAGGNANLIDNMDGTYQIACDGGTNCCSMDFGANR